MDDKGENYPDPERTSKRIHLQQQSIDNVSTYNVEDPGHTD